MPRLALCLALIVSLATPATGLGYSRVHEMRSLAVSVWGPDVCGNTMAVPIQRVSLPVAIAGRAYISDCKIEISDIKWASIELCKTIIHEYGHVALWGPLPGEEFVRPDGTLDVFHSNDPTNPMYPTLIQHYSPCERRWGP